MIDDDCFLTVSELLSKKMWVFSSTRIVILKSFRVYGVSFEWVSRFLFVCVTRCLCCDMYQRNQHHDSKRESNIFTTETTYASDVGSHQCPFRVEIEGYSASE